MIKTTKDRDTLHDIRLYMDILTRRAPQPVFDSPDNRQSGWFNVHSLIAFDKSVGGGRVTVARIERLVALGLLEMRNSDGSGPEVKW